MNITLAFTDWSNWKISSTVLLFINRVDDLRRISWLAQFEDFNNAPGDDDIDKGSDQG